MSSQLLDPDFSEAIQKAAELGVTLDKDTWRNVPAAVVWDDGTLQLCEMLARITGGNTDFTLHWKVPPGRRGTIVALVIGATITKQNITAVPGGEIWIEQRIRISGD